DAVQIVQLSRRRWRDALPLPLAPVREGAPFGDAPARASLLACGIAALAYNAFSMMTQVIGAALDLDARNAERLPAH
ncbi:type II toxin-antitoxin system Phd/YefM family antitoxin, partial [Paraburkholderia sp. SIMBA_049]